MAEFVNIVKLCVGADAVEDLARWQKAHFGAGPAVHVTCMWPKRTDEVLGGGSLYWVIKGQILALDHKTSAFQRYQNRSFIEAVHIHNFCYCDFGPILDKQVSHGILPNLNLHNRLRNCMK